MPVCEWVDPEDALMISYHDKEWGVPSHDDTHLFEMLILEGAQAGLSWRTILHKREGYRRLFASFNIEKIARFTPSYVNKVLVDPGIVRNRLKVESTITNAQAALHMATKYGSLDDYIWKFVDHQPITNQYRSLNDIPASTRLSDQMSKQMKKDGFRFVGTTICYAFMQAVGMVNDHVVSCPRHRACQKLQL